MKVRAHTCYLGHTGFASHARNFFRELSKHVDLRVRNYTWDSSPTYLDEIDFNIIDKITLRNSDNTESDYPISNYFPDLPWVHKEDFQQDVDIVLMDMRHNYFYQEYTAPVKIAYTVWESTELDKNFFNQLLKFDYVWVVTQWHKDMIIKQGYPEDRVAIVNEGVNSIFFEHKENNNDKFRFMFFGRWDYRKAVPEIIDTFLKSFPNNDNVELILSADNPYSIDEFNSTEERLQHYGFNDDRIKVLHFPKYEEYVNYIKTGNVLITCARSEGWNIPLIEAMAAGTPTIYSNWGAQLEFAKGLGNPVTIKSEMPANIGRDLGFASDTPGLYAEPDYEDLKRVLIDCYDNYQLKKELALNQSEIIKQNFNWEKIGKDGFKELKRVLNKKEVIVIMSHCDNDEKLDMLRKNLVNSIDNGFSVILTSHIEVPKDITNLCDYVIIDKDNPIISYKESKVYTSHSLFTFWNYNDCNINLPFKYNHSYAALKLIRNGFAIAEYNSFEKIHFINYDYIIDYDTLNNNSNLLENYDLIGYYWDSYNKDLSVNTGFFSTNCKFGSVIKELSSKKDYFKYNDKVILEDVIGASIIQNNINYKIFNIDDIKNDNNIINKFEINNRWISNSGCISGKFNNDYYIFFNNRNDLFIKTNYNEYLISSSLGCKLVKIDYNDLINGIEIYDKEKTFIDKFNIDNSIASFKVKNINILRDINNNNIEFEKPTFNINYNDGPFVEILKGDDFQYNVKFINSDNQDILYETTISKNCWTKCSVVYYVKWRIEILNLNTGELVVDNFDLNNKLVRVKLDSSSLGDTLAWLPHVNEFAEKNNCDVIVSTFKNFLFDTDKYPRLTFVNPGDKFNTYASYNIGWFYENDNFNRFRNPRDFKNIPLQTTTTDILGLHQSSLKPFIRINDVSRPLDNKYICIAIHSTAQAKYWNNPTGWQEIVDHYKLNGYEVVLVSSEKDGYMGNKNPEGVLYMMDNSMDNLISYLNHCDLFIGISSGISWLSWALNKETVIISGFSKPVTEPLDDNIIRVFKGGGCNGCFNRGRLDAGDWNWCPDQKGTVRQFECSKIISSEDVLSTIDDHFKKLKNVEVIVQGSYDLGMVQNHKEILDAANFFKTLNVKNFMEIGTDQGGSFAIWSKLSTDGIRISVDLPHGMFGRVDYDENERDNYLRSLGSNVHMYWGDSHDITMLKTVEEKLNGVLLDFMFIDGDHTYEGVKQDFEMYKHLVRPDGWIAFHDIKDTEFHRNSNCRVDKLWSELQGVKYEFIDWTSDYGGIGFIQV
jgi:autotransporter strand-loop-strand O-heptosyltransferase